MALKSFNQGTLNTVSDAQGLVHINTTTITGTPSSVSVDDVFSSTYKTYLVNGTFTCSTGNANRMRLRASGSDATGNDYVRQTLNADSSSVVASTTTQTYFDQFWVGGTTISMLEAYFYNPFETTVTSVLNRTSQQGTGVKVGGGQHGLTNSYTGFTLICASGTFTSGTIRVYGLKE